MQINISGHHLELSEPIKDYVNTKFDKLERHNDRITNVNVILTVEGVEQKAEANVHASGKEFFADSNGEDIYAAIDTLVDKLDRQLIKHKEKMRQNR